MEFLTSIGFLAGIVVMVLGITSNGSLLAFFDVGSIYITIGGTITAMMMNFPLKSLKAVFPAVGKAFFAKKQDPLKVVDNIVELAEQARKGGILSLEDKADDYKDEFITRGIMAIMDSHDPDKVRDILENEAAYIEERHISTQTVLEKGAAYAPAFGMIGTLIGLINMLVQLDDPDALGSGMAIALVTTFYGSILANLVFLPLAGKLKSQNESEMFCKQLIIEGVLAIQVGENPRLIKERLSGYFPSKIRAKRFYGNTVRGK